MATRTKIKNPAREIFCIMLKYIRNEYDEPAVKILGGDRFGAKIFENMRKITFFHLATLMMGIAKRCMKKNRCTQ